MKRNKKRTIPSWHAYGAIVAVVLLVIVGGWLFSQKKSSTDEVRDNSDFKSSSLRRFSEISEQIKGNKVTGEELKRLETYKRNIWSVTGYEGYTPFSNLYYTVQGQLNKSPDGERLYGELRKFGSDVREKLAFFIEEPTDDRLRDFEEYLVASKPEIRRLIGMAGKARGVEQKTLDKIVDNLEKLLAAIDHRRK